MTISDSTLRNTFYADVYTLINTSRLSWSVPTVPSLEGSYPDTVINVPSINIPNINVSYSDKTVDTTQSSSLKTVSLRIFLTCKSNKYLDILSDYVSDLMNSNIFTGLQLTDITEDDVEYFPNEQKLHTKVLSLTYIRRS